MGKELYTIDPQIKRLIPALSKDERNQLEANIKAEKKIRDAVVIGFWNGGPRNGTLLDGHNRDEIAEQFGLGVPSKTIDFKTRDEAINWVIRNQLGRRNINDAVRTELASKLRPEIEAQAKANQKKGGRGKKGGQKSAQVKTRDAIAQAAGVSHDTVDKVEHVVANAAPAVAQMMRDGEVSINAAHKVASMPKGKQKKLAKGGAAAVKAAAKKATPERRAPKPTDEIGHIVPGKLRRVFDMRDDIDRALNKSFKAVSELVGSLAAKSMIGRDAIDLAKNLRAAIKFARPHAVCPLCGGEGCGKQTGCKGTGYLTEDQYSRVDRKVKADFAKAQTEKKK